MIREPDNQYDEHAISVHTTGGLKLGYLPRKTNLILSRLMDEDMHVG
ncbi:HIRAN domain-containing protein [Lactobacillus agrestimuris]|nr:HIRAN domain-containing protein [Lactobacillus agrestimuris]